MKANNHAIKRGMDDDSGVSPVIAVILMVAITVVLAATVYVWVSGFSSDDSGPENAQVRATGFDSDDNGASDWIRLTLVRGENAPYGNAALDFTLTDPNNVALIHTANGSTSPSVPVLCEDADHSVISTRQSCEATSDFGDVGTDSWDIGEALYVPCQAAGQHLLSLSIRNSVVLEETIRCDETAQDGVS